LTLLAEFELIPVIEQLGEMELVGVGEMDSVGAPTPTEKASGSLEIGASSAIGDSPTEEYPIPTENASESLEVGASSAIGDSPTEEYPYASTIYLTPPLFLLRVTSTRAIKELVKKGGFVFKYWMKEYNPPSICTVCQENFFLDEELIRMDCSHVFHHDCLVQWLRKRKSACPYCNSKLNESGHHFAIFVFCIILF
jgi:hypothetical protein